jgi:glutamate synthase (NADPH) large chain
MATIDLSSMTIRTANEVIKGYGATYQSVRILNPDAKHYIAVGLTNPIHITIDGSAGYFCGGLTDSPRIHVKKNVSWGVGDNMLAGKIVVEGNAGAIAGEALRGGEIVIKGNMGSRAGQVMKKGTLCCAGKASFMAGYMMYGGRMIILGDSGPRVGENMAGGSIFVGGAIESVGSDAKVEEITGDESDAIRTFLDRYKISFKGTFQKVVCAGNDLKYATPEPKLERVPFTAFSGSTAAYWNPKIRQDIQVKSKIGRYRIRGYGTARHVPHLNDLAFKKDIIGSLNHTESTPRVNLRTLIGDRHGARALDLSMPVVIAPMSYGALGPNIKIALGMASRLSGIAENTGEGGMNSVERAEARQLIAQCLSGRLGWNIHDMMRSDGLEIYISQGAKPGLGGQLMGAKLTEEIAQMRGIPAGMDLRSPSRHPDILGGDDLIMKVQEFRESVGGRLPISLKLGGGRTRDDVKIAFKDGIDFIELDGLQGGTGAAGDEVAEFVGIPTIAAIMEAVDGLDEIDAGGQLPIVLMGGIQNGVDAAKALALGASAVGIGTGMLIASGCTGCMDCSSGNCPIGIATQEKSLVRRLNMEKTAMKMHRYLESIRWQLTAISKALGHGHIRGLCRDDLVALTPEAAELTRLPYCPEARPLKKAQELVMASQKSSDKETGSANFARRDRRSIRAMSRLDPGDGRTQQQVLGDLLVPRDNPFPADRPETLDDVVFLSAALTRLVIDPYREICSTRTRICRWSGIGRKPKGIPALHLQHPFLFTGFDSAPKPLRRALAHGLRETGCGYMGRRPLPDVSGHPPEQRIPWLQLLGTGDLPDARADGLIHMPGNTFRGIALERQFPEQLMGLSARVDQLPLVIPYALDHKLDLLVLDGTSGIQKEGVEKKGHPDLTVLRDALALLRKLNREEEIALLYFGGMRTGTDVAKILALNCSAAVFSTAMGFALGGKNENDGMQFNASLTGEHLQTAAINWIKATSQETAIIARCTGKTNVHNLEPEDMRAITLATSRALGLPMASGQKCRERF